VSNAQAYQPKGKEHRDWIVSKSYETTVAIRPNDQRQAPLTKGIAQVILHLRPTDKMTCLGRTSVVNKRARFHA